MTVVLCTNAYKAARAVKVSRTGYSKKLPVLNTIHLYHHEGRLAMTAFQFEPDKPLTEYVSARCDGELFDTCVPAKPFTDWLYVTQNKGKNAPDQIELTLEIDGKGRDILKIRAGNSRAEFVCMKASEFPPCTPFAISATNAHNNIVEQFEAMVNVPAFQTA